MDNVCKELKKIENLVKTQGARIEQLEKKLKSRKPYISAPARMQKTVAVPKQPTRSIEVQNIKHFRPATTSEKRGRFTVFYEGKQ